MGVYGASFVRARPDVETSFRETCRQLRDDNERWVAASPTNLVVEHTVRATENSEWISIENAVGDVQLEAISRALHTTALTLYAIDEKVLRFSYCRFDDGGLVRSLEYADDEEWTRKGDPEPWETTITPSCNLSAVVEIARAWQLPWHLDRNAEFPSPSQIEIIPGDPERVRAWLHQHDKPWWKFWT